MPAIAPCRALRYDHASTWQYPDMLADFIQRIECALRDEASQPYILMGLLVCGVIGVALGHGLGPRPYSRKLLGLLGMAIGVVLGAVLAALFIDACGP